MCKLEQPAPESVLAGSSLRPSPVKSLFALAAFAGETEESAECRFAKTTSAEPPSRLGGLKRSSSLRSHLNLLGGTSEAPNYARKPKRCKSFDDCEELLDLTVAEPEDEAPLASTAASPSSGKPLFFGEHEFSRRLAHVTQGMGKITTAKSS